MTGSTSEQIVWVAMVHDPCGIGPGGLEFMSIHTTEAAAWTSLAQFCRTALEQVEHDDVEDEEETEAFNLDSMTDVDIVDLYGEQFDTSSYLVDGWVLHNDH